MKIVIIGNGVAGITAALTARQRDPKAAITVVSGETPYYFSRTALMYAFMDQMTRRDLEPYERGVYSSQGIELVHDWMVNLEAKSRTVSLKGGGKLDYDVLVLALGARPNRFSWDGLDAATDGVAHFVSMQDLDTCERLAKSSKRAVVVGGGLIGIELVECLTHHNVDTTFLIREPYYWPAALAREEAEFVAAHIRSHGVDVRFEEEMKSVAVDGDGRVSSVDTSKGNTLPCEMLGLCVGVHPATESLEGFDDKPELGRGIVVNEFLETSLEGVFACGDCAEISGVREKNFVEAIWYSAKRQGALVGQNLFGDRQSYCPPTFFNSSKFFEIEYTTVGDVVRVPDGTPSRYMRLDGKNSSARIVHDGERVLGFNMLGSRWNHEVLVRWVDERRTPNFVFDHLRDAQYDVELGRVPLDKMSVQDIPMLR